MWYVGCVKERSNVILWGAHIDGHGETQTQRADFLPALMVCTIEKDRRDEDRLLMLSELRHFAVVLPALCTSLPR